MIPDGQKHTRLPSWESLTSEPLKWVDSHYYSAKNLHEIKQKPHTFLFNLGKFICHFVTVDEATMRFLNSKWSELVDIVACQSAFNLHIKQSESNVDLSPFNIDSTNTKRIYSQQPCTLKTVKKRANIAKELCQNNDPILLIGDDDFISLKLAQEGFTDITVVDIDRDLLAQLEKSAKQAGYDIKYYYHDLKNEIPPSLKNAYKLIFLDPFYTIEGANLFLKAATKFTRNIDDTYFFMSFHLMSLLKKGLQEFELLLNDCNLSLLNFYHSFNQYPVPKKIEKILHFGNKIITRYNFLNDEKSNISYFSSDAILLASKNSHLLDHSRQKL